MSQWATLEARFKGGEVTVEDITDGMPTGSERGPTVGGKTGDVYVDGRLRDFHDYDSPAALAWFVGKATMWATEAEFLLDIDGGPRYRYRWVNGELTKLRGLLDA